MPLLQLSSILLLVIFTVSVTSKDLIYYHTIKHLSSKTFIGQDVQNALLLDMRDCDIETVANTTFTGMSKLQYLLLLHNNIRYLPDDVFNSLEDNLDYLRLDSNKLEYIPNKLFAKLPKLQELRISYNLLSHIEPGAFDKNIKLKKIYLEFNRLQTIPAGLFSKLTELVHLDLSDNFITLVDHNAFPANLQELLLFANRLRHIHDKIVNNLKVFLLDKNPLHCDCRLKHVHGQWAQKFRYQGWTPNCAGPKKMYNIRWDKLSSDDFVCTNEMVTMYPEVSEIPVSIGENITIGCHVAGAANIRDVVITYRNNTEVTNQLQLYDHPFNIQFSSSPNSLWYNLTISNMREVDDEIYKCVVKNEYEMEIKVRVEDRCPYSE